jgi:Tfp pilus assembly protein PilX
MNRIRAVRRKLARGTRARPGFAMFMALGALVIIAVLVAGSSFITLQETRLGQNQLIQSRAFAAAEYGLNKIQADWDKTPNLGMNNGETYTMNYTLDGQGTCDVRMTRLNNETFWLVSTGTAVAGNSVTSNRKATKRVGALIRLRIPTINANGAITTNGQIQVKGSSVVNGNNVDPNGWTGCSSAPNKPGLVVPPGVVPDIQKASNVVVTSPNPIYATDPLAADDNTYVRFGDETWTSLETTANQAFYGNVPDPAPTTIVGDATTCNKANPNNWGEPQRGAGSVAPCYNYFPIIFATCNPRPSPVTHLPACLISFNQGRGQGILLIDGDIKMNGQFEWFGLIIVSGDVGKGNGAAHITGGVMARNADIDQTGSDVSGNITFQYSACSIERAMRGSASVSQAKERSFTELY